MTARCHPTLRALGLVLATCALLVAHPAIADEPVFELRSANGAWTQALTLDTAVEISVRGLVAEVKIRQEFRNQGPDWMEGRYLLPLPENAAVGDLRIRIGAREIVGEVREKDQARAVYAAATAAGHRSALVEQSRPNLFRTAVSNIGPGETVVTEIGYWQQIDYRGDEFVLSLPLTLTRRYTPPANPNLPADESTVAAGAHEIADEIAPALPPTVTLTARIEPGIPIEVIDSRTHALDVKESAGVYQLSLREVVELSDRDFELHWRPQPNEAPQQATFLEQGDDGWYALTLLVPPSQKAARLPRELILVIDHSGSMQGMAMTQTAAAAERALTLLTPSDRFNVLRFDDQTEAIYSAPVAATAERVDEARRWIRATRSEGGTVMAPALVQALAGSPPTGYVRQVVLATDAGISNEQELYQIIERSLGAARLFPVGLGSAPNGDFLRRAAQLGRGGMTLIRNLSEIESSMTDLFARIDRPLLTDVRVRWPAGAKVFPERLPDLYAGAPLLMLARLPQAGGLFEVQGLTKNAPWKAAVALDPGRSVASRGIRRLWARAQIQSLEDELRLGKPEDEVRKAIVSVALAHGLASRYTSLIAIEQQPARADGAGLKSAAIQNANPHGSLGYAQGSSDAGWMWRLAIGLLMIAACLFGSASRDPWSAR